MEGDIHPDMNPCSTETQRVIEECRKHGEQEGVSQVVPAFLDSCLPDEFRGSLFGCGREAALGPSYLCGPFTDSRSAVAGAARSNPRKIPTTTDVALELNSQHADHVSSR
jgi:hypothetical protein